jgi:AcrR family transcriptional regulator
MQEVYSRKTQIEIAATELFRKKGYSATSMRDLAQAVGVEAASIYSHIKNKEELLANICFRIADSFMESKKRVESISLPADEQLLLAIQAHVQVIINNLDASAVFLHEWRHLSTELLAEFIALRKSYENYLIRIIQKGSQEGIFIVQDEKMAVLSLLSGLNWIYDWYKPEGKLAPEDVALNLAHLILHGIQNKPESVIKKNKN